ncbi:MAG: DUF2194 domain-containing protein, partial [Clostridia bacterium]|nr:DUF2194 domain-containing protein [Clostridia bacterium]
DSAWSVQLNPETTKVYARKKDSDLPLIWEAKYGKGKFVVDNFGLYEKNMRGFFAASYSLLGDVGIYPVINASVFYLDDFPSQVPSGENEYITRDYHTTVRDFYVNIWWPAMMNFADKYNLKYTGLAIMCYNDTVNGSIEESGDDSTFTNFGNMLLRQGGELGYHGYNHQPLCLGNVDYEGFYDYKTWNDYMSMRAGIQGLVDFCDELFPDVEMSVYVPPSNILSAEGRAMLLAEFPEIRTISGTYFPDGDFKYSCVQEFDVTEDGVVDQPRIISGCAIDDFMAVAAVSELNLRFINNHFTHPDDALDPERGALLGWKKLSEKFDSFLNWLYTSAPTIRNLTGSDASVAIQRYVAATVSKTVSKDKMTIKIGNFYDEAQLFVRFNERKYAGKVDGGKLTHLTGDLYLLEATKDTVTISLKQE